MPLHPYFLCNRKSSRKLKKAKRSAIRTQTGNKRLFTIFQYMICCYSTIIKAFEQAQKEVFQYIPYYYSTFPVENLLINLLEFQYISCCYSTNTILFNFIKSRPFQYILCYYSTFQAEQLDTIFQYVLCYYSTFDSCPFF